MISIDDAIKELSDRMELRADYRGRTEADQSARNWLTVLRMSRDALQMQKQNADTKRDILEDLGELKPDDTLTVDLVIRLVRQFRTGDEKHDGETRHHKTD